MTMAVNRESFASLYFQRLMSLACPISVIFWSLLVNLLIGVGLCAADGSSSSSSPVTPASTLHHNTVVTYSNTSQGCTPCPPPDDQDSSVGVIIGSAIAGAVVGAVVTATVMTWFRNRSRALPPKDYQSEGKDDQVHFDVNCNNDEVLLTNGGEDIEDGSVRTHKKLERLVQRERNTYHEQPDSLKTEMAAIPLIHSTDSSSDVELAVQIPSFVPSTPTPPTSPPTAVTLTLDNIPSTKSKDKSLEPVYMEADNNGPGYFNVGLRSPLEQPYDALAVVPEEVEYENHQQHVYEPILKDTNSSTA